MQNLIRQEQFELEVLEKLNSGRLLAGLVFVGGTMLRLCHGLERYSVDLDFWLLRGIDSKDLFKKIKQVLRADFSIKDSAEKFNTLIFEIKSPDYPSSLKIEIRKNREELKYEESIAYSPGGNIQVVLKTLRLPEMMKAKMAAFLDRHEIRDVFDMEFLVKKGIKMEISPAEAEKTIAQISRLKKQDYSVKLGSLLPADLRGYYRRENFKILKAALEQIRLTTPA